ncbi:hypothetical protein ACFQ4Q_05875 [Lysobacter gummosus]|uniref:hypothetical protein n=2 Tax=Lysobacter gummosus TaxID=262324 RepID=UPI00362FEEA2
MHRWAVPDSLPPHGSHGRAIPRLRSSNIRRKTMSVKGKFVAAAFALLLQMGFVESAAAACGTATSQLFDGGAIATRYCDGWPVNGLGTTLADASQNAGGFSAFIPKGYSCLLNTGNIGKYPGGFRASFQCGGKIISGVGSTATDTGNNALGFAQLDAAAGSHPCLHQTGDMTQFVGGFRANFQCNGAVLSGMGSTATDAGRNALGFAELHAAGGGACLSPNGGVRLVSGYFEVTFYCDGRVVKGIGSTVTTAGQDALANAH